MRQRFGIDLPQLRPVYARRYGPIDDAMLLRRVQTDFLFTSAALALSGFAAKRAPAWTYHFAFVPSAERQGSPGAPHCADMDYLFGPLPQADQQSRQVGRHMQDYWYAFIRNGAPAGRGLPPWPATQPGKRRVLLVDAKANVPDDFGGETMLPWFARWRASSNIGTEP